MESNMLACLRQHVPSLPRAGIGLFKPDAKTDIYATLENAFLETTERKAMRWEQFLNPVLGKQLARLARPACAVTAAGWCDPTFSNNYLIG